MGTFKYFYLLILFILSISELLIAQNYYTAQIRVEDLRWKQWPDYNASPEWEVDLWGDLYDPSGNKVPESEYDSYTFEWWQDDTGNWVNEGGSNYHWCDGDDGEYYSVYLRIYGNGVNATSNIVQIGKTGPPQKYIVKEYKQNTAGYSLIPSTHFKYFTNPHWYGPPYVILGDYAFILTEDGFSYIKVEPYELIGYGQKFSHWNTYDDILNFNSFEIPEVISELDAHFNYRIKNAIIQANFLEIPDAEILGFKDPWLVDLLIGEDLGMQNRGNQAPFKYFNSIDFSDPEFDNYKGVLLDQNPNFLPNLPNYSIKIPSSINLPQNGGIHSISLQNWIISGASLEDFNSLETGVVFTNPNGATITANLKGQGLSKDQDAYSSSSERKLVQSFSGSLLSVYKSMDKIWLEVKENYAGLDWTLLNYDQPLNLSEAKGSSLDFSIDSYPGYDPVHQLLVVFQEKSGNNSIIKILYFERLDIYESMANLWHLKDTKSFLAVSNDFDNINCTPVISFNPPNQTFNIIYKGADGLYIRPGSVRSYVLPPGPGGITLGSGPTKIIGTNSNSVNPSIYTTKSGPNYTRLVWEENNTIKYIEDISSNPTIITLSTNDGYTLRNDPSLVVLGDGYGRICWKGTRYISLWDDKTQTDLSYWDIRTVFRGSNNNNHFWYFGQNIASPNINKADDDTYYTIIWTEENGLRTCFADNTLNNQTVKTINIPGQDVQVSNGPSRDEMYAEIFNNTSLPYYFSTSNDIGSFYSAEKITNSGFSSGRQGTVSNDSAQFYFMVGDIIVENQPINFIEAPDSINFNSKEILNEYLRSESFELTDNSDFMYSVLYGITDSSAAVNLLSNSNKNINFKLQLVDSETGEILGTFDDVTYDQSNIYQYNNISYQVNTEGIGNRNVFLKLKVEDNFEADYSLAEIYSSGNTLHKISVQKRNYNGNENVNSYDLYQNYPNPFNPTTNITYQVLKPGNVELKVYDILGREVMTLVNDFRNVGKYTVDLNASRLASGVYFYRLKSGEFVSTKKMVLLK